MSDIKPESPDPCVVAFCNVGTKIHMTVMGPTEIMETVHTVEQAQKMLTQLEQVVVRAAKGLPG